MEGMNLLEGAYELNTLISKKVLSLPGPQKPSSAISTRAPFSLLAERPLNISPLKGCSSGSNATFVLASDNSEAVTSLI